MNKKIKNYLQNLFNSRIAVLATFFSFLFIILFLRFFVLQIINGEKYQKDFSLKIKKELTVEAARGNIYDRNGKLLAYNELAYSVTISDNDESSDSKIRNKSLNSKLKQVITQIHKNNDTLSNDYQIVLDEDGNFVYTVDGTRLKRFLADTFHERSYSKLGYNKELKFNTAKASAEQIMNYYSKLYQIPKSYSKQLKYDIIVARVALSANKYSKYRSTTIAKDVSDETVAYINEHSQELKGISIEEATIRKYNDPEYFASILGYTGKISNEEFEDYSSKDKSYTNNDEVGKAGIEQYYEKYLRGINGKQTVLVDNVGRISKKLSKKDAKAGNNVYLSVDKDLQIATYKLLEQEIAGIVYAEIRNGIIPKEDVYASFLKNSIIDTSRFDSPNATDTEKAVRDIKNQGVQEGITLIDNELRSAKPAVNNNLPEKTLDYFTYLISELKNDKVIDTSKIDSNDSTYQKWREGNLSPKEYLSYCIKKQWIDISKLNVDEKYANSDEVYDALCKFVQKKLSNNTGFTKIVYQYLVKEGRISGTQVCVLLYEQGILEQDEGTLNGLKNGTISPFNFLLDKINKIEITPAQLALEPCTGSTVITDPNNGEILAMVSYPGYDNNRLANGVDSKYYAALNSDLSKPLYNYATQERTAPGSTFKMISATAGMSENVITPDSVINCGGVFNEVSNKPRCWIYPSAHGPENVSTAIKDSCNVFFYTVGYRLASMTGTYNDAKGIEKIQKYAKIYGLDKKTGIEIPENTSAIATEYPVMAAIGQSNNNFTTVSLSRYVTAITSGKLYTYKLMNKIVNSKGKVLKKYTSKSSDISSTLSSTQWTAIHNGMNQVITTLDCFKGFPISVAGKTGTAQQAGHPNHGLFVGYAPFEEPKITIATRIAHGFSSHNAAAVAQRIMSYYLTGGDLNGMLANKADSINPSGLSSRSND
ncbi:penicillin-binding transpeptidase domain-containing protein [Lachnobacterium bovis]|uniref:Penicillin-binding protein 2 n=1 Tax=Lachnobacterium bovis TaxID=140626 RepID=A0A1H9PYX5_9FIRM|nr:penicillin-binding transpeptidase domain-containing protein [Lachnobacterium bovis]SER53358.1 penicillin-binding protein 2 [Lachnobacterium bovis]